MLTLMRMPVELPGGHRAQPQQVLMTYTFIHSHFLYMLTLVRMAFVVPGGHSRTTTTSTLILPSLRFARDGIAHNHKKYSNYHLHYALPVIASRTITTVHDC